MRFQRTAISGLAISFGLLVVAFAAGGYFVYQAFTFPKAAVYISTHDCSTINYQVTNKDSRIFHGWAVEVVVTPSDSQITVSPEFAGVAALAPQGTSNGTISVAFANGAPVGTYQISANLVNGSQTIATSNSLSCTLK
jgi:hypothetical protein